ncbi:MAG: hypothetical protein R6U63_10095 [Longimicrobiales bacterium]
MTIEQLFASSPHGFGNFEVRGPAYAGGSCAACHTSQGYVAAATGADPDFTGGVASMNCRTCHQIHSNDKGGSLALTTTDPVTLRIGGTTVDFGKGNLCVHCHQGRVPDFIPTVGAGGQDTIPARYGTHYGPQANVFAAAPGLPAFGGAEPLPTTPFTSHVTFAGSEALGCVGCHMQSTELTGNQAGGHTWGMTYGGGEVLNDGTCDACHADVTAAFDGIAAEVQGALDDLQACLQAEGVIDGTGSPNTGAVVDNDLLAAFLVWQAVTADGSGGAHHPEYVPAILANANDYLDANYPSCAP